MAVYWFKYRGKPTGKMFTYVASNRKLAEQKRKKRIKEGFRCSTISKSYGQGALIFSGTVGKYYKKRR